MLLSPKMWRTLIKPRLARLFEPIRAAGLPILMHSDGHIEPILPDLVEIGLNMYNPVQPEVTDFCWLRETFGNQLAYYGGVSTQTYHALWHAPTTCVPPWPRPRANWRPTTPAC